MVAAPSVQSLTGLRRRLVGAPWRLVEGQHVIATRNLVDTPAEHEVLEALLEASKPPRMPGTERLHYLLATPFRYPPLRHGSRLGTRFERGIWYGAEEPVTAMAEVAFHRLCFLADTRAALLATQTEHTLFRARIDARPGIDLRAARLRRWHRSLLDPTSWSMGQVIGSRLRGIGVKACRLGSARHPGGTVVAVFEPSAFAARSPDAASLQTWHCDATRERVVLTRRGTLVREEHEFRAERFGVHGTLRRPRS